MTAGKLSEITAPQAIKASASGRHLVRAATGQPFFWKGDTAWELCEAHCPVLLTWADTHAPRPPSDRR